MFCFAFPRVVFGGRFAPAMRNWRLGRRKEDRQVRKGKYKSLIPLSVSCNQNGLSGRLGSVA